MSNGLVASGYSSSGLEAFDFVEVGKVLRTTSGPFGSDGITLRKKM